MKRGQFLAVCWIIGLTVGWALGATLLGCDVARSLTGIDGEVYRCDVGVELELCWRGAVTELAADLASQYGLASVPCGRSTRPATWFGCIYECPPPAHGCDAYDGCYCPKP